MVEAIREVVKTVDDAEASYSLAITNQRETAVVWNRFTGKPVYNAVVCSVSVEQLYAMN